MVKTKTIVTDVTVPHLAESLVSATIGRWLRQPGDQIEQYDILCELITDKVNVEMPSPVAGTLLEIVVEDGETAAVGEAICRIQETLHSAETIQGQEEIHRQTDEANNISNSPGVGQEMRHRYSPAVQRMAAEHGIDLSNVLGSGIGGRITRKDVERLIENVPSISQERPANLDVTDVSKVPVRTTGLHLTEQPYVPKLEAEAQSIPGRGEYYVDVTPIRNTIASRTRQSVTEIPHAWTMIEVDVTNLVILRNKLKDDFARKEGINLTYLAFVLKAVVNAIKDYPLMNSVWGVDKIIVKRDINISLAVGTEDFVVTPVIRKADEKTIAGLAREIDELTKKARTGKLSLDDLQGGTFTVNNTGSFGSILSYPIINYPQAAIITFENIVKKPVVIDDMIAVRSMVNLCLSLDHRILDGVICGRFLQRVKENLESYNIDTKLY